MWTRRAFLTSVGTSLVAFGTTGQLRSGPKPMNRYFKQLRVEERPFDLDADTDPERLVRVRFVPTQPLVAVRLEQRVEDAFDPALAREFDQDRDGWYVIARRIGLQYDDSGTEQVLTARRSRRIPDAGDWLAESRGYQPGSPGIPDVRGFKRGALLRVVVVPHGDDPVVVSEHVVGTGESDLDR